MTLSDLDLDVLQAALLELHKERDLESFHACAPLIVLAAIPGDYFVWTENGFTNTSKPLRNIEVWDHPARLTPKLMHRLMALLPQHPFTLHARETGDWGPVMLSDFWTDAQVRASALWRDVYRKQDAGRLLACAIFRANRMCSLNVARPFSAPNFSERDRAMMRLLTPHFTQAYFAAERITSRRDGAERPLAALGLTSREAEVGAWLARGRTNPEIAKILAMQARTVEKHVERILIKLGVENRTAAAMRISGQSVIPSTAPTPSEAAAGTKALHRRAAPRKRR